MSAVSHDAVLRLPANDKGRDFVVGDLHGCFDLVWRALDLARFDPVADRLFSVGDLVDRGPNSAEVVDFLSHAWVHAVRGNHEDMLLEAMADNQPVTRGLRRTIGGDWWDRTDPGTQGEILEAITALPMVIDVGNGTFGVVHADVPAGMNWSVFLDKVGSPHHSASQTVLWGRDRVMDENRRGVPGIGQVFLGHTRIAKPMVLGNVWAIDTGAVYGYMGSVRGGSLTLVEAGLEQCQPERMTGMLRVIAR